MDLMLSWDLGSVDAGVRVGSCRLMAEHGLETKAAAGPHQPSDPASAGPFALG